jgi:hypothetical protein
VRESECASKPKNGGIVKKRACMRILQKKKLRKDVHTHCAARIERELARESVCMCFSFFGEEVLAVAQQCAQHA